MLISTEDVEKIKEFAEDVKDTAKTLKSVSELNDSIKSSENTAFDTKYEINSLKYEIELKDNEISDLKQELSKKEKIIEKSRAEKENIKEQLQKFKSFWKSIMSQFHKRICYDKDENYQIVSDDLYKNGIFDDNENEIANNIYRKVTIPDENKQNKNRKNNYFNLN